MKPKGFSLIELMIYLTLLLLLMYDCIPWSIAFFFRYNTHHAQAHRMIDCCVLHDLFLKDIFEGSCKKSSWFLFTPHSLIWKKNDGTCVGWIYKNNTLYRATGSFSPTTQQWHKKQTVPVLYGALEIVFHVACNEKYVHSIHLDMKMQQKNYSLFGVPRYAND